MATPEIQTGPRVQALSFPARQTYWCGGLAAGLAAVTVERLLSSTVRSGVAVCLFG
jgi:hypothetical protein